MLHRCTIVLVVYTCSGGRSKHEIYLPHFRHFGMQVSFVLTEVCNLLFPEISMKAFLTHVPRAQMFCTVEHVRTVGQ